MKWIFIFWYLIICFGCENHQEEKPNPRIDFIDKSEIKNRLEIVGDFDGDSFLDTLKESYFSKATQKEISKLQFDNQTTQIIVDSFLKKNQPRSSFYILNNEDNLEVRFYGKNYPTFGITGLLNLGNIDNEKGDEIGIVIGYADRSLVSSCEIFSYKNKKWIKIDSFRIHETQIWDNQKQEVVMELKKRPTNKEDLRKSGQGIFCKENGKVYFYSYDEIKGQIVESIF